MRLSFDETLVSSSSLGSRMCRLCSPLSLLTTAPVLCWAYLSLFNTLQNATNSNWDTFLYSKLSPKNTSLPGAGSLINYFIRCCGGKCLIASSPGIFFLKKALWFIVLFYIHGINSPRFKLPTWHHKSWAGKRSSQLALSGTGSSRTHWLQVTILPRVLLLLNMECHPSNLSHNMLPSSKPVP